MQEDSGDARRLLLLLLLLVAKVLLGHSCQPVDKECGKDVEDDKCPQDAKVAPPVIVVAADALQELVRLGDGAVRAFRGGVVVLQASTKDLDV